MKGDEHMTETIYRTGQAAKLLSTSSHHIRKLCEAGIIEAELTQGNQWKIRDSEIERMREEGLPPIPHQIELPSGQARRTERNPPQLKAPASQFPSPGDDDDSDPFPVSDEVQIERDRLSTAELRLSVWQRGRQSRMGNRQAMNTIRMEAV